MIYVVYDHSFEGFLSAVFEIYERKLTNAFIRKTDVQLPLLFVEDTIEITTNEEKANRVAEKLEKIMGQEGVRKLWKAWLTEDSHVEDCIFGSIRYSLEQQRNILSDYGNLYVIELSQKLKMIEREKHRMEAFVRFQLTNDELYYSVVEPDFNVLPLILPHFKERYADQRWLIYDLKRHYGIYYDKNTVEFINFEQLDSRQLQSPKKNIFAEEEELYQTLWKDYFKSANIQSRKNTKLHVQHVPKRYWKYLTEKGIG
ncbi:MAG TPA: TIGR03915 family putative DNA repair protein [Bacteroidia bacterium]|nr:TIGR03915 family putative DNA repair protein [Bacteroidia bacterium]